ncbi:hypothetical protein GJ496_011444 [Pomphorhynchus laevis]|nr:hypothetical protein GJ496_011444 [Pomphorhynchus laevis]
MWKCGDVYNLLCEARFAQRLKMEGVKSCKTNDNAQVTKIAINLIKNGMIMKAARTLKDTPRSVLSLSSMTGGK